MKETKYLLTSKEAISMILTIVISKLILNVPATLVLNTNSGTLINLLYFKFSITKFNYKTFR